MGQAIVLLISQCIWHGLNTNLSQRDLTRSASICVYCPKLIHAGDKETEGRRENQGRKAGSEVKQSRLEGEELKGDERETKCVLEER